VRQIDHSGRASGSTASPPRAVSIHAAPCTRRTAYAGRRRQRDGDDAERRMHMPANGAASRARRPLRRSQSPRSRRVLPRAVAGGDRGARVELLASCVQRSPRLHSVRSPIRQAAPSPCDVDLRDRLWRIQHRQALGCAVCTGSAAANMPAAHGAGQF
jgi:hypothetical protein